MNAPKRRQRTALREAITQRHTANVTQTIRVAAVMPAVIGGTHGGLETVS